MIEIPNPKSRIRGIIHRAGQSGSAAVQGSEMTELLSTKERLEYLLNEARRQLQQGAYRMASSWAYHAKRLAGDDLALCEQAEAVLEAARRAA